VDLRDIKAIIDLMKKNSISEFELEKQDFKIKLKRGGNGVVPTMAYEDGTVIQALAHQPVMLAGPGGHGSSAQGGQSLAVPDQEIKSPMIGTFYRSPSPESAPYIEVGMEVNPDTVVCIIEAMKVMNEIKAEIAGVISQVLVENAKPVEFGQPLFKLKSA
jgi:acetyl-CoA carboxylase biotin carboxyl carrier protein